MCSKVAIEVTNIGKCYQIYEKPHERLLQMFSRGRKQYYREFWAVKDVSFKINKGETVGIIGRNGSGKSTLLQLICGTLKPTSGTVKTHGRIAALLELGSGFNPEFTGRENIFMNASLLGLSNEEIKTRFHDIVAFADIGDFIEQPVKTYSSGMMLRLAFAVIAHVDANILVIDEALAVGDAFFTQKCMRFLRDFIKQGTVLFVSHDTASVKSLCNHAVWLEKGRMLHEGAPKEICELYLEAFFEARQGKSRISKSGKQAAPPAPRPVNDPLTKIINNSNLQNDLQVFKFNPDAAAFGKGGAQIDEVCLLNDDDHPLSWIVGGERVTLRIIAHINQTLDSPIIGFYVNNNLGQQLFGDNTFLRYREQVMSCDEGSDLQADFVFYMPLLPRGDYSITVSIANGTQHDHEHHHWIHDAVIFKSESSSIVSGLMGIPMQKINLHSLELS